jgi:hypothetical protein
MRAQARSLYYNITEACGNACVFCASDSPGPSAALIPAFDFQQSIERHRPTLDDEIILNGGEPTAHPDFRAILDAAVSAPARVILFTNGRALAQSGAARELGLRRLHRISIPLYSAEATTHDRLVGRAGAWSQSVAGIVNVLRLRCEGEPYPELELKLLAVQPSLAQWPQIADLVAAWPRPPERVVISGLILSQALLSRRAELIPNRQQLVAAVNETLRRLRGLGIPLILLWSIPPCLLEPDNLEYWLRGQGAPSRAATVPPAVQIYHDFRYREGIELPDDTNRPPGRGSEECDGCQMFHRCEGMPRFLSLSTET